MFSKVSKINFASSFGSAFEWYDFNMFGLTAPMIAACFFPGDNTTQLLLAVLSMTIGVVFRPVGSLLFGSLGDKLGRKNSFTITLMIMGVSTGCIGLLPSFQHIGNSAWMMLIVLRIVQGLALGGEYGGAVVFVAEHDNKNKNRRGMMTSWVQSSVCIGVLVAFLVICTTRFVVGNEEFARWGWRVPYLLSFIFMSIGIYIRYRMKETPVFEELKKDKRVLKNPLKVVFSRNNIKKMLIAMFGVSASIGVMSFAHAYMVIFMISKLHVDYYTTYSLFLINIAIGTPLFIFFGHLSDRCGVKKIMVLGSLLGALTVTTLMSQFAAAMNPELIHATRHSPVNIYVNPDNEACDPTLFEGILASIAPPNKNKMPSCLKLKHFLTASGIDFTVLENPTVAKNQILVNIGPEKLIYSTTADLEKRLRANGYPATAHPTHLGLIKAFLIMMIVMLYVAMLYGPAASFLISLFPSEVRYTCTSLPYHVGVGWFGGLTPVIITYASSSTGKMLSGFNYVSAILMVGFIIGIIFIKPDAQEIKY